MQCHAMQCHAMQCNATELGSSLVDLLSNATSALSVLNLTGNQLKAQGVCVCMHACIV
jgi:hypothetical protein